MIKERRIHREYLAICKGSVTPSEGTINAPLGRKPGTIIERTVDFENGEKAITHYHVMDEKNGHSLVSLRLETGRTHQIRVHMAYLGHPVAGDPVYGPKKGITSLEGQCLHAGKIGFVHPRTGEYLEFEAPLPAYFTGFLQKLKEV